MHSLDQWNSIMNCSFSQLQEFYCVLCILTTISFILCTEKQVHNKNYIVHCPILLTSSILIFYWALYIPWNRRILYCTVHFLNKWKSIFDSWVRHKNNIFLGYENDPNISALQFIIQFQDKTQHTKTDTNLLFKQTPLHTESQTIIHRNIKTQSHRNIKTQSHRNMNTYNHTET